MKAVAQQLCSLEVSTRQEFHSPQGESFSYLHLAGQNSVAPLVFSHANGFNAHTYRQLFLMLQEQTSVYAMDLRGHGFSQAVAIPEKLKSWDTYRDDLIPFVEQFEEPVVLAGHSMGSLVNLSVAAARPDLVKGILLIEPPVANPQITRLLFLGHLLKLGRIFPITRAARNRKDSFASLETALQDYTGRGAFTTWDPSWIRDYLQGGLRPRKDGKMELCCTPAWESRNFELLTYKAWSDFKKIQCPITLMHGGAGSTVQRNGLPQLKAMLPDLRLVLIEEATHFLPMEFPQAVVREILNLVLEN